MCWVRSVTLALLPPLGPGAPAAPGPTGRWLIMVPSIVSPRYCATPSERTAFCRLVQVIDQVIRAPLRCALSRVQPEPKAEGTALSAAMQLVYVVLSAPPGGAVPAGGAAPGSNCVPEACGGACVCSCVENCHSPGLIAPASASAASPLYRVRRSCQYRS